jgi:ribose transport system substrate-binding protein
MENLIQRFPQIDAVFAANDDMAVGAVETLIAAGRNNTLVVGVDGIPDAVSVIREGKMFATADYSLHDQAYLATHALVRKLRGEQVPAQLILPVKIASKENIGEWAKPADERPAPNWAKVVAAQAR